MQQVSELFQTLWAAVWVLFYTSDSLSEGGDCHVVNCSLDYSKAITASANLSTYFFFFFAALAISELHQ